MLGVLPVVDFGAQAEAAATAGLTALSTAAPFLFALPVAWVGYKVIRKVVGKIG